MKFSSLIFASFLAVSSGLGISTTADVAIRADVSNIQNSVQSVLIPALNKLDIANNGANIAAVLRAVESLVDLVAFSIIDIGAKAVTTERTAADVAANAVGSLVYKLIDAFNILKAKVVASPKLIDATLASTLTTTLSDVDNLLGVIKSKLPSAAPKIDALKANFDAAFAAAVNGGVSV